MTRREFILWTLSPLIVLGRLTLQKGPGAIEAFRSYRRHCADYEFRPESPIGRLACATAIIFAASFTISVLFSLTTGAVDAKRVDDKFFLFACTGQSREWVETGAFLFFGSTHHKISPCCNNYLSAILECDIRDREVRVLAQSPTMTGAVR